MNPEEKTPDLHETPTLEKQPSELDSRVQQRPAFLPEKWDRYQILECIGEGAMGHVYKAYDPRLNRHVALKFFRGQEAFRHRFLREARAQAGLDHPNICKIYETGEAGGHLYIAMQFVNGPNLGAAVRDLTLEQKVTVMRTVAEAVHAAHRSGLIHRDVKPGNILLEQTPDGMWQPYVTDFGLVREADSSEQTATGMILGTPGYMAPEQALGEQQFLDRRADVYGLGATLYAILAGRPPYEGTSIDVIKQMIYEEPSPLHKKMPSIPSELETIVMKCLQREPQRRYDSARALAEDLTRYLDGEPILARPSTTVYRVWKKAKKHKTIAMVASIAIVMVAVLLAYAIHAQIQATRKAQLAQRFGQDIERMESLLYRSYTLPLHDTRKETKHLRQQIAGIESLRKQLGRFSCGPAYYAIGRGYLALRENDRAYENLQKAWEENYRPPEVALALGLTLGNLYQKELEQIERMGNENLRLAKKKELEKQYRDSAVQYLQAGKTAEYDLSHYVEALIHFYEKRYEAALQKAKQSYETVPWLYEARILQGDIHTALANREKQSGRYDQAMNLYKQAESSYGSAIRIAESDPQGYAGLCILWNHVMNMELYRGASPEPFVEKALTACTQALTANPDLPGIHSERSLTYRFLGEYQSSKGIDPTESFQKAVAEAREEIKKTPGDFRAYSTLATAYSLWTDYEMVRGMDFQENFEMGKKAFLKAIQINKRDDYSYHNLAIHYLNFVHYAHRMGIDASGQLRQAIELEKKAIQIQPENTFAHNALGNAYWMLAARQKEKGQDPTSAYQSAIQRYEHVLKVNPNFAFVYNNRSSVMLEYGKYLMKHNRDAAPTLKKALESVQKGLELAPENAYAYFNQAKIYHALAEVNLQNREVAEDLLSRAFASFEKGLSIHSEIPGPYEELATSYLLKAQMEMEQNRSPWNWLQEADRLTDKALSLNPQRPSTWVVKGRISMARAKWNSRPYDFLSEAIRRYQKALQQDPGNREAQQELEEARRSLNRENASH